MGFFSKIFSRKYGETVNPSRTYTNSRTTRNTTTNIVSNNWHAIRKEIKVGKTLHEIYESNSDFNEMMEYSEFKNDCYCEYLKEKNGT